MLFLDYNAASEAMDAIHQKDYADKMHISAFRLAFIEGMQYYFRMARIEEARREASQKDGAVREVRDRDTDRGGREEPRGEDHEVLAV